MYVYPVYNNNCFIIKDKNISSRDLILEIVEEIDLVWKLLNKYSVHKEYLELQKVLVKVVRDICELSIILGIDIGDEVRRVVEERGCGKEE